MRRILIYLLFSLFLAGCKLQADSYSEYDKSDPSKTYRLRVNPIPGSNYHYEVTNETTMSMEVEGKEIENENGSVVQIGYKVDKDTASDGLLLTMQFEKIRMYSKNNGNLKEIDADNGTMSGDPVEKLFAILKETKLQSTLSPRGETKLITGFNEIGNKIMAAFPATDEATRMGIEAQWNKTIGDNLIKSNIDQFFKLFPDSAVRVGDTWKIGNKLAGQLPLVVKNIYTLKAINDDIIIIESQGTITTNNPTTDIMGIGNNVVATLTGEQQGEYEMEAKTGMLIRSRVKGNTKGTIQVMGREIPIKIKTDLRINGTKNGDVSIR